MARSSTKSKPKTAPKTPVTSHAAKEDDDLMMLGFYWGERSDAKDKTPYDFLPDKEGYRSNLKYKPSGVRAFNLQDGIPRNCTLPPVAIWEKGWWLNEVSPEEQHYRLKDVDADIAYYLWVVDGAGQPGNWEMLIYYLSDKIASDPNPKHPRAWTEFQRRIIEPSKTKDIPSLPVGMNPVGSTTAGGATWWPDTKKTVTPAAPKAVQAPSLPAGVRIRCPGCGHWHKESDLAGHAMVCSSTNEGSNDWAIMCAAECGCRTLDEASAPKPGFPRPKPDKKTEEVKPVSETIEEPTPEETPEEETEETETPEEEVIEETEA